MTLNRPLAKLGLSQKHEKDGACKELPMLTTPSPSCALGSTAKSPADRLESDPFWFRAFLTQPLALVGFIFLIIAVEERDLGVAFKGQNMGSDAVEEPAIMG